MQKYAVMSTVLFLLARALLHPAAAQAEGMLLQSPDFAQGAVMPALLTCDGAGLSPALAWHNLPAGTQSLAISVVDPDAPSGPFTHWLVWGIDPAQADLPRGVTADSQGVIQGRNSFGDDGYGGPCPPAGQGAHHYVFTLYALDAPLDAKKDDNTVAFARAISGHVLARAQYTALYERY